MGKKHTKNKHDMSTLSSKSFRDLPTNSRTRPGSSRKCGGLPTLASFQGGVPLQVTDVECWKKSQEFLQTCRSAKREVESDQAVDSNQDEEENVTLTSMDMDLLATQPKPTEPPSHSWTEYEGYWFWRNLPSNIDSPGLQQQNTTGPKEKLAKLVKTGPARRKAVQRLNES